MLFGPHLQALLVLEEGRGRHDLLREDPRVAANGKEVVQGGMMKSQIRVGDGTRGKEGADAFFNAERVRYLSTVELLGYRRLDLHLALGHGGSMGRDGSGGGGLATGEPQHLPAKYSNAIVGSERHDVFGCELFRGESKVRDDNSSVSTEN